MGLVRLGGGVFANGRSSRAAGVAPAFRYGANAALAGAGTGAWRLIESTLGRIVALVRGPGRTGIFLLWPGKTQAPAAVYPPCQTLALRDEGEGTGGVMQADHMSINFSEGGGVKEFDLSGPARAAGYRATSRNFLAFKEQALSHPLSEVDGLMSLSRPARTWGVCAAYKDYASYCTSFVPLTSGKRCRRESFRPVRRMSMFDLEGSSP